MKHLVTMAGVAGLIVLLVAGCSGDAVEEGTSTGVDASSYLDTAGVTADGTTGPDLTAPPMDIPPSQDTPTGEGQLGAPCSEDEDCFSLWCVPSPEGKVCSKTCQDNCPEGFSCQTMVDPNGQPSFVCIHIRALLCLPCLENKNCNQTIAGEGNACVDWGEEGSFCGTTCGDENPCPAGYQCQDVAEEGESPNPQCMPTEGMCDCSPLGVQVQALTTCSTTNDIGTCASPRYCFSDGLAPCGAPEAAEESCNHNDDDCDGPVDEGTGGEFCNHEWEGGSCDGTNICQAGELVCTAPVAAEEQCNGLDDDCDGGLDEDFPDTDQNGVADCLDDDNDGDGVPDDEDCAPLDPTIYPGATEVCNQVDDDCDQKIDEKNSEGCTTHYLDLDLDTFGDSEVPTACLCGPDALTHYTASVAGDCDDLSPSTWPGAPEPCNGIDDDCNGLIDDTDSDADQDGVADCLDDDDDNDGFPDGEDCGPQDPSIYPGADEACDGIDTDCDGQLDEEGSVGCAYYLKDADGDGQGSPDADPRCLCTPEPSTGYTAQLSGDCDDLNPEVYAGAQEVCNGLDDDCDTKTDEGETDTDQDGDADCVDLDDDDDGTPDVEDCAPLDPDVSPTATESCNGIDDNCSGLIDEEGAAGCEDYWRDVDQDGFGSDDHPSRCLCAPDTALSYVLLNGAGDCDDLDEFQNPNGIESCNGEDDNCNGVPDEGVQSPCDNCATACWAELGPSGLVPFSETVTAGLNVDGQGHLLLATVPGAGFVRYTFDGWPSGSTLWDFMSVVADGLDIQGSGQAWVTIRFRAADNLVALTNQDWSPSTGPFPDQNFPLEIGLTAQHLQVEVTLHSSGAGAIPSITAIAVMGYQQ